MKGGTVAELLDTGAESLRAAGIDEAKLQAEHLLAAALGIRRMTLYHQRGDTPAPDHVARFRDLMARRLTREPLQYVLGEAAFRELTLRVDRRVLIPRPETEVLVGAVLDAVDGRAGSDGRALAGRGERLAALDIGTGSGAIAISLVHEGPFDRVVATDVSKGALAVARENAQHAGVSECLEFRHGPGWSAVRKGELFDVVVSNPPYIAEPEREGLPPEVREFEPAEALFGGHDGLDVAQLILGGAWRHLRPGGLLALELAPSQAPRVAECVRRGGVYESPRIMHDLTGRARAVLARLADTSDSRGTEDHE